MRIVVHVVLYVFLANISGIKHIKIRGLFHTHVIRYRNGEN